MNIRKAIAGGVFAAGVFLTSGAARAQEFAIGGFVDESGEFITEIHATLGEPVWVDVAIMSLFLPIEVWDYELGFILPDVDPFAPEIEYVDFIDANGGLAFEVPPPTPEFGWGVFGEPLVPVVVPPEPPPTVLGTLSFAGTVAGTYHVEWSEDSAANPVMGPGPVPIWPAALPVTIYVGEAPLPHPGPPPVPVDYQMGTITNGDFEAGGGSLDGWEVTAYQWTNSSVSVEELSNDHTDNVAVLHAEGYWNHDEFLHESHYDSSRAYLEQTIYVPKDATEITFVHCSRRTSPLGGQPGADVKLGGDYSDYQTVPNAGDWQTFTLPVSPEQQGRRLELSFRVDDDGYGWEPDECYEGPHNTMDLYLDYVGIDGTTVLQSSAWNAAGGGAWGDANNWDPTVVPDNSLQFAYDVTVPETAGGPSEITVAAAREVQSLDYRRTAGSLLIPGGGQLTVIDFASFYGAAIDVRNGGGLSVEGELTLDESAGGTPSSLDLLDATVAADNIEVRNGSEVTLTNSPGFVGQTQLQGSSNISIRSGSSLTLNPGTAVVTADLDVWGTLTVQDATITHMSPGYTSNIGTVQFTGTCLVDHTSFGNSEDLTFTDAEVTFTGSLLNYDNMQLIRSEVTVQNRFYIGSSGELWADADSRLRVFEDFNNDCTDPADFRLEQAEVIFSGAVASELLVQGTNAGPFDAGFADNFGLGTLAVEQGDLTLKESGSGHAQYVFDLVVGPGTTLDLNGIPLYYVNSFTNNGDVIGEVRQAYPRPEGLPVPTVTSYTASAEANDEQASVDDGPVSVEGWSYGGWEEWDTEPAYARAEADAENAADLLSIHIELYGHSGLHDWPEMQGGDPIPSEASGEVDALFTVPANDTFPDGAPAELLIVALAADLAYYGSIDWSCKLYRGEDEIATMDAENDELLLSAVLGETLRLHAWADDGVWWAEDLFSLENYHSTLDINVYTLSAVPEPSALALLCVGAVGLLACGRRKRP